MARQRKLRLGDGTILAPTPLREFEKGRILIERESGNMLRADVKIPRWTKPLADLVRHTNRTHPERLEFRTTGFDRGGSVELIPWFRLTHERYNLYWRAESA